MKQRFGELRDGGNGKLSKGTHGKVAQRWTVDRGPVTVDQRSQAPLRAVGLPTKTEDGQDEAGLELCIRRAALVMLESRLDKINKSRE